MSPIQKVQARAAALETLGLAGSASPDDIRRAWKRLAFETHPDKSAGESGAFLGVNAAFEYLKSLKTDLGSEADYGPATHTGSAGTVPHRAVRPHIETRTDHLAEDDIAECRALLEDDPLEDAADHVAEAVHRKGRDLLYVVPGAAAPGLNRVALPAAVLTGRRKVAPKIVSFRVAGSCVGEILVPEETRLTEFPGARSVRIRFCQPPDDCGGE